MTNKMATSLLSLSHKILHSTNGHNIIAITGGSGHVGKTWCSIALAHLLTQQGCRVLLFDGNLGLPGLNTQLKLTPSEKISDALTCSIPLNQIITSFDNSLDIITGTTQTQTLHTLSIANLQLICDDLLILATHYDYVILDLGPYYLNSTRFLSKLAKKICLLCTPNMLSLIDAYNIIKQLSQFAQPPHIQIVMNNMSSVKEADRAYATLINAIDNIPQYPLPPHVAILHDEHIPQAIKEYQPLTMVSPNCLASQDVKLLIQTLLRA